MTMPPNPGFESKYPGYQEKIAQGLADADAGRISDGEQFFEELEEPDPETETAIEEGLAQADRGEGRPWHEIREELRARFKK
jgi:predicted transcriptional regulator